jgi:cell division protein FtsQ
VRRCFAQKNSTLYLIDEDGKLIEEIRENPWRFPIVLGDEANTKAHQILQLIRKFQFLRNKLESLILIRDRRWDISLDGLKIKLPEENVEHSLEILSIILKTPKINKTTVKSIDLRNPELIVFEGLKIIKDKQNVV